MPTISAHLPEESYAAFEAAVKASDEKKPGPYIAEAVLQRMAREGMLPGNPHAELIAAAEEVGVEKAIAALKNTVQPAHTQLVAIAEVIGVEQAIAALAALKREARRKKAA